MTAAPKKPLSKEAIYTIIRSPLITEKMTILSEQNQVGFKVSIDASKPEIAAARSNARKSSCAAVVGHLEDCSHPNHGFILAP